MFIWVALNENVKQAKILWTMKVICLNPKISVGATEKLHLSEKLGANISSWSYDMEGHAKKCVKRYCDLANKTTQQQNKVATPCLDDHQFKDQDFASVGELAEVCSRIVLKMFMVLGQTCTCCHKVDLSMRPTLRTFDLIHSSHL